MSLFRKPIPLFIIWVLLTILFSITSWMDYKEPRPQASMDPGNGAYADQLKVDEEFPRDTYFIPFEVLGENVLAKEVLLDLRIKSEKLRKSDLGKNFLVNFENTSSLGFYSIADGVEDVLKVSDLSLMSATDNDVDKAIYNLLNSDGYGSYFRSVLSNEAKLVGDVWNSPAFSIFVASDNQELGGGVFRRNIGGDSVLFKKEQFNRDIEQSLQSDKYRLLGIGIDLNLEANEEGYSFEVLSLIFALILTLMIFVGVLFRSFSLFILSGLGLLSLFIWIRGFSFITFGLVAPSLTTEIILPIAFMAFGIDFLIHVIAKYNEEDTNTMLGSMVTINKALVLATITTGIAFGVNYMSNVDAIQSFAITGIFAALAAYFIMGNVIPIIFERFSKGKFGNPSIKMGSLMNFFIRIENIVLPLFLVVTVVSIFGISLIQKNLDPKDFISSKSNFVTSLDERDRHFGDTRGEESSIYIIGSYTKVNNVAEDLLPILNKNKYLAHTKEGELILPYGISEVHKIDNNTFSQRIIFEVVNTREQRNIKKAFAKLENDLEIFSDDVEYKIIGSAFTRNESLDSITDSLTQTLLAAIIFILLILIIAFRSLKYALITLTPMLFVVIWTYGAMGLLGFSLNFITATIAAIALGVGIDYSVHIVEAYRREGSIDKVGDTTGFAILISGVSSIIGFIFLSFAPMPLFATYGILAATMISFSLLTSIVILPIILSKIPRKNEK